MGDSPSPAPASADDKNGDDDVWKHSPLGSILQWPESLRSYFHTICALPHPAALFYGETQILLGNNLWTEGRSTLSAQGQPQRDNFSEQLRTTIDGGKSQELRQGDIFEELTSGGKDVSAAILSSLHPSGTLVQLIRAYKPPRPQIQGTMSSTDKAIGLGEDTANKLPAGDKTDDDIPIDQHPYFRGFAELLPSGLAILDRDAKAMFVNTKFWDLTTLQENDEEFTAWPQSIHPDDYERVMGAYQDAFKTQQELRIEFRARAEPHPWRLLLLTPLGVEHEKHISTRDSGGFICSIVDISSEKSAELAERKAAQQSHERKEQQERFIDMISHEIRNPLSAVLHCAEDISEAIEEQSIDIETIREALSTIDICVKHQKNIVDDVLSFSKLDSSMLALHPSVCEPADQLRTTLKMFKQEFRKGKLHFSFDVGQEYRNLSVQKVMADMPRVGQVLINLMTNAIKFTQRGNREKRVSCQVSASKERPESYPPDVVFFPTDSLAHKMDATNNQEWGIGEPLYIMVAVRDTGIGISQEGQKRLFERFRQATPKTEEVYGGSGLGLNISRKICQLHGGEIGVSSKEGEGSTFGFFFKVRNTEDGSIPTNHDENNEGKLRKHVHVGIEEASPLPRHAAEPFEWKPSPTPTTSAGASYFEQASENVSDAQPQQHDGVEENHEDATGPSREDNNAAASRHVLLVEDNKINQRILSRKLANKGFKVTTANNGQEAVTAVKSSEGSGAFDIILMDMEMPVMDGNRASREIRGMEKRGEVERAPIIGVSANVREEQQNEMLDSGMDDVIAKPYTIDEMVAKINKVAGTYDSPK